MQQPTALTQQTIVPMQQTAQAKAKIFFPNLDGLRFISFLVVFLYHGHLSIFSYLKDTQPRVYSVIEFLFRHGNLGVNFFFVLIHGIIFSFQPISTLCIPGPTNRMPYYCLFCGRLQWRNNSTLPGLLYLVLCR